MIHHGKDDEKEEIEKRFTFTCMHLADIFIQSDLQYIQVINVFVSMCVPWELIPQPLHC